MRFLEDNELPPAEHERRTNIRVLISHLGKKIDEEWERVTPEIEMAVRNGHYGMANHIRMQVGERTELIRDEMVRLHQQLPPIMEMRADGHFEMVPPDKRGT